MSEHRLVSSICIWHYSQEQNNVINNVKTLLKSGKCNAVKSFTVHVAICVASFVSTPFLNFLPYLSRVKGDPRYPTHPSVKKRLFGTESILDQTLPLVLHPFVAIQTEENFPTVSDVVFFHTFVILPSRFAARALKFAVVNPLTILKYTIL